MQLLQTPPSDWPVGSAGRVTAACFLAPLKEAKAAVSTAVMSPQMAVCALHLTEVGLFCLQLDYAKRHLTHTITSLRRLAMLTAAVDDLEQV